MKNIFSNDQNKKKLHISDLQRCGVTFQAAATEIAFHAVAAACTGSCVRVAGGSCGTYH
jgi:hypothetical protein